MKGLTLKFDYCNKTVWITVILNFDFDFDFENSTQTILLNSSNTF